MRSLNLSKTSCCLFTRFYIKCIITFEQLILLWAIENYVPLCQFGPDEIYLLFYEELCANPEAELTRLFAFLQMPLPANLADMVARPSRLVHAHSAISTGESLIDRWRVRVSADQVARAVALLGHFGLDQIYNEASMPMHRLLNKCCWAIL